MASETIKYITGAGEGLRSQMLIFDALYGVNTKVQDCGEYRMFGLSW